MDASGRGGRLVAAAAIFIALVAARAPDPRFAGAWRISAAEVAPWVGGVIIARGEDRRLIGSTVTFRSGAVSGPPPLGCTGASYAVRENDGPDMLFEGMLAENGEAAARAAARRLGMNTPTIATLEVGCTEIQFHAIGPGRLLFGLDNRIYTMVRAAARK